MKNELILLLSSKGNYPCTPAGKVDFLILLTQKAMERGNHCVRKHELLNSVQVHQTKRYHRGIVYKQKKQFGIKYNSWVNYEPLYQTGLIHLSKYIVEYANENNALTKEKMHVLSNLIGTLGSTLRSAILKEEHETMLNW